MIEKSLSGKELLKKKKKAEDKEEDKKDDQESEGKREAQKKRRKHVQGRCYNCQEIGHMAVHCKKQAENEEKTPLRCSIAYPETLTISIA